MNYFGHACLALERSADARFVLGAMLPDLASMLRAPCPASPDAVLSAGLAFHHATDAVFHQTKIFTHLNQEARSLLRDAGMRHGPARAVAHVGTEMLLDAVLIERPSYRDGYLEALTRAPLAAVTWRDENTSHNFITLAAHLEARGTDAHSADPERLVFRLSRALAGRARLELTSAELPLLADFGEAFAGRVASVAEPLLLEVRKGLEERAASSSVPAPPF